MPDPLYCAPNPCDTCPYKRDTPPGIWSREEYEKLRTFDTVKRFLPGNPHPVYLPTAEIATVFHCHQENRTGADTVCRGWVGTHNDSVFVRFAMMRGVLRPGDVPYGVDPTLYATGTEACEAGLAGVEEPSDEAQEKMDKLIRGGGFEIPVL